MSSAAVAAGPAALVRAAPDLQSAPASDRGAADARHAPGPSVDERKEDAVSTDLRRAWGMRARRLGVFVVGAFALALVGCTDARVVDEWRSPEDRGAVRSWLVVARTKDAVRRRQAEDAIVDRLRRQGVDARPSYTRFPDGVPGTTALARSLDDGPNAAALVIAPVNTTTETRWVPGYRVTEPRTYYNPWRGRGVTVWRDRWVPGWRERDRVAHVQVSVWRGGEDAELVYGATVEVTNPESHGDLAQDVAGLDACLVRRPAAKDARDDGAAPVRQLEGFDQRRRDLLDLAPAPAGRASGRVAQPSSARRAQSDSTSARVRSYSATMSRDFSASW